MQYRTVEVKENLNLLICELILFILTLRWFHVKCFCNSLLASKILIKCASVFINFNVDVESLPSLLFTNYLYIH